MTSVDTQTTDPPEREGEHHALLPSRIQQLKVSLAPQPQHCQCCKYRRPLKPYLVPLVSFRGGGSAVLLVQLLQANYPFPFHRSTTTSHAYNPRPDFLTAAEGEGEFAPPYIASSLIHNYPSPTNHFPSLFPTQVGYPGQQVRVQNQHSFKPPRCTQTFWCAAARLALAKLQRQGRRRER